MNIAWVAHAGVVCVLKIGVVWVAMVDERVTLSFEGLIWTLHE